MMENTLIINYILFQLISSFFVFIHSYLHFIVPCGCIMVAGGFSLLASEFPAAQRVLDRGKEKLRNFAEHEEEEVAMEKDDVDLDFEMLHNNGDKDEENSDTVVQKKKKRKGPKESLRQLTKNKILPLLDRSSRSKRDEETDEDIVVVEAEEKE